MVAANAIGILAHFPQQKDCLPICPIHPKVINKYLPWDYSDGSAQGTPTICDCGVVLYLKEQNWISFKEGLGEGTNKYAELRALSLLLSKETNFCCSSLQVFGDSTTIINWENGIRQCHNLPTATFFG